MAELLSIRISRYFCGFGRFIVGTRECGYVTVTVFIGIHRILDGVIKSKLNSRKEISIVEIYDEKFISVN